MARISFSDLIVLLESAPGYRTRIRSEISAEQALYIAFGEPGPGRTVDSEVLEIVDGAQLVIDRDRDGKVCGIEIC